MHAHLFFKSPARSVLAALVTVCCMSGSGCKEYVTEVSSGNILDPSIKPVVLSSYPSNLAVGPFAGLFAPGANWDKPSLYVQFNKLMIPKNYIPPCYWCFGYAVPIEYLPTSGQPSTILYFTIRDIHTGGRIRYEIGKIYSFTVDSSIEDINGNHLLSPYTISYEPEPHFRVTSTTPGEAGTFPASNTSFSMNFNSPVEADMLTYAHVSPDIAGHWDLEYDSLGAIFRPLFSYHPSTVYAFQLDAAAHDRDNHPLPSQFVANVSAMPMKVVSAEVYPQFSYLSGSSMASLISIGVTFPCDSLSVLPAVTIAPPAVLTLASGASPKFFATNDFAPSTSYQVTISTGLRAFDGTAISSPYTFSFRTDSFRPLLVTYDIYGRIELFFSGRVTMPSLESAFSIDPHVGGTFTRDDNPATEQNSPEYWFTPSPPLQRGVQYRVRLDTTLTSVGGYRLAEPANFVINF